MDVAEKREILQKLNAGREELRRTLADVDDALALRRPDSGRWSVLDCVEHVIATEQYLLSRLDAASISDEPFEKWRREAKIATLAMDRKRRIEAPQQVHPRGCFKTVGEAMAAFDVTRSEVVRWVENCSGDLRCMTTDHALIEGPVTCAEVLIMIAALPARHAQQIEETKRWLLNAGKDTL
jgi:hypothetical protein